LKLYAQISSNVMSIEKAPRGWEFQKPFFAPGP